MLHYNIDNYVNELKKNVKENIPLMPRMTEIEE